MLEKIIKKIFDPIIKIRIIIKTYKRRSETDPIKPNSSENNVKIKSVCFSGKKSRYPWVPFKNPLPNKPPEPTAILDCIIW